MTSEVMTGETPG